MLDDQTAKDMDVCKQCDFKKKKKKTNRPHMYTLRIKMYTLRIKISMSASLIISLLYEV